MKMKYKELRRMAPSFDASIFLEAHPGEYADFIPSIGWKTRSFKSSGGNNDGC